MEYPRRYDEYVLASKYFSNWVEEFKVSKDIASWKTLTEDLKYIQTICVIRRIYKAVNWNTQEDMTNMFWRQNISQMWVETEFKVSKDIASWKTLTEDERIHSNVR